MSRNSLFPLLATLTLAVALACVPMSAQALVAGKQDTVGELAIQLQDPANDPFDYTSSQLRT